MESTLATSESVEEQREHAAVKEEEPSVNSDCRETRIAARRKRVLLKIEADRRAALGEKPSNVLIKEYTWYVAVFHLTPILIP